MRAGGHSYPKEWYEDAVGSLLAELGSIDDFAITEVVRRYQQQPVEVDRATLARVAREREEAAVGWPRRAMFWRGSGRWRSST